jgi:hypothetical protein
VAAKHAWKIFIVSEYFPPENLSGERHVNELDFPNKDIPNDLSSFISSKCLIRKKIG